jgi:tetratricopeptide (TPR) repeat protein
MHRTASSADFIIGTAIVSAARSPVPGWLLVAAGSALLAAVLLAGCQPTAPPAAKNDAGTPLPPASLDALLRGFPQPMRLRAGPTALDDVALRQAAIRTLLLDDHHDALEAALAEAAAQAVATRSDRWFAAVFDAFDDADAALTPALDRWILALPASPHAHAARGFHHLARAAAARGAATSARTAPERLAAMDAARQLAQADLETAARLDPRSALAAAGLLDLMRYDRSGGAVDPARAETRAERRRRDADAVLARAEQFRDSFTVQHAAIRALQPKWGGDAQAMLKLAAAAPVHAGHDDFKLLRSYAACLIADELRVRDRSTDAVALHHGIDGRYGASLHPWCLLNRADAELAAERAPEAEHSLRRYLALIPHGEAGWRRLAQSLRAQDREADAIAALDAALALRPASTTALCQRARYDRATAPEAALARIARALEQNPLDRSCWIERSRVLARLGRSDEALVAASRATELDTDRGGSLRVQGAAFLAAGRHEDALSRFDAALEVDRADAAAWNGRGLALRQLERTPEAVASFDRAIELAPDHGQYWYDRGLVRAYLLRDVAGAERDFGTATETTPELAAAWFELAGVRYRSRNCAFVPALRAYAARCERTSCESDRLAWTRGKLDDPGLSRLCPGT